MTKFCSYFLQLLIDLQSYPPSEVVVESFDRITTVRKSSSTIYEDGVTITSKLVNNTNTRVFTFSTLTYDEANSKLPILIFPSRQFSIGPAPMGRKVMLYLIDHADTIFVVTFPSPAAATRFHNRIFKERVFSEIGVISEAEMVIII